MIEAKTMKGKVIHPGQTPQSCDVCGKKFQKGDEIVHTLDMIGMWHVGCVKPLPKFKSKSEMRRHLLGNKK